MNGLLRRFRGGWPAVILLACLFFAAPAAAQDPLAGVTQAAAPVTEAVKPVSEAAAPVVEAA